MLPIRGIPNSIIPFHLVSRKPFRAQPSVCLSVMDWMRASKWKLNPDHTEVHLVNQKADQGKGIQIVLDRITLPLKNQVFSLGMLLYSALGVQASVVASCETINQQKRKGYTSSRLLSTWYLYGCDAC